MRPLGRARTSGFTWPSGHSFAARSSGFLLRCGHAGDRSGSLDATDLRTDAGELLLDRLVAAIEVVDAEHFGRPVGDEPGEHEARRRAEVGRHDLRARQPGATAY